MRSAIVVAALVGCSRSPSVQCGSGTILKNGVCEAVAARQIAADAKNVDAVVVDAGVADLGPMWSYDHVHDEMRGTVTETAAILSTNAVKIGAPYDETRLGLMLRYAPPGSRAPGLSLVALLQRGQFDCGMNGCALHAKIDDGSVVTLYATEAAGGNTGGVFVSDPAATIARMRAGKRLTLEVPIFHDGARQFTFDVEGLVWNFGAPKPQAPTAAKPAVADTDRSTVFECQAAAAGGECIIARGSCSSGDTYCQPQAWCYRLRTADRKCYVDEATCNKFGDIAGDDASSCKQQ